mmetsp:Transcript_77296/g.244222  ORF Transcript_77296/g.244222 Transcript_77296/m.244222 type:complete len:378 (-) Transcript_77296:331-1464(-)
MRRDGGDLGSLGAPDESAGKPSARTRGSRLAMPRPAVARALRARRSSEMRRPFGASTEASALVLAHGAVEGLEPPGTSVAAGAASAIDEGVVLRARRSSDRRTRLWGRSLSTTLSGASSTSPAGPVVLAPPTSTAAAPCSGGLRRPTATASAGGGAGTGGGLPAARCAPSGGLTGLRLPPAVGGDAGPAGALPLPVGTAAVVPWKSNSATRSSRSSGSKSLARCNAWRNSEARSSSSWSNITASSGASAKPAVVCIGACPAGGIPMVAATALTGEITWSGVSVQLAAGSACACTEGSDPEDAPTAITRGATLDASNAPVSDSSNGASTPDRREALLTIDEIDVAVATVSARGLAASRTSSGIASSALSTFPLLDASR